MDRPLLQIISEFIFTQTYSTLPDHIKIIAREHLLDTLGCCLAATKLETTQALVRYVLTEKGAKQASAMGTSHRLPVPQAAFINGLLARSLEFDDMAMPDLHPSGVLVPVSLAMSEFCNATGAEFITAIALGLELCIRLGRAGYDPVAKTSLFLKRGQDATAICGTVAGAAIAAKLLGLDAAGIANAMGIAVSFASGSLEANRSGGNIKQFQSGWAAQSAVQAAFLTKYGVTGPAEALEGAYGFYQCFIEGKFNSSILINNLGHDWLTTNLRYKPYPSNYYTHAGIDAALQLRKKGLNVSDIKSLHLAVAKPMLHTIGEPLHRKQNPRNAYEAKFSAPYTIASALIGGSGLGLGVDDFKDNLVVDPIRLSLMQKTVVESDPHCDVIFPEQAPAILTAFTKNGKKHIEEVFVNRGSPQKPLSSEELFIKFNDNVHTLLSKEKILQLYKKIEYAEKMHNVKTLIKQLKKSILPEEKI